MGGDYTRYTFDPTKAYSGVLEQQGRVRQDAGFNEFEAILDRRRRVETIDTIGPGVTPSFTPDGFEIAIAGGLITIGPGRAYVDGIQVECLGAPPPAATSFELHVGEIQGTTPLPYAQQPFLYTTPPFPALSAAAGITDLVYLDVWQREVSVLEDEELLEPALNGPDTTTRVQSAWQVKVLNNPGAATCLDNPAAWTSLIAPSTARLTAAANPGPPSLQPCVIEPGGGYTGLENRLYRVEVHTAGVLNPAGPGVPAGAVKARFKWSRDNASLAAAVVSIVAGPLPGQSTITVRSTGRDRFLRFEPNDHIELLDDHVEWSMRESGTGGSIAQIVSVDYANSQLIIDQNLSGFAVVPARHPRVKRWDVDPGAAPAMDPVRDAVPGIPIALEQGITITFNNDPAATLHAGDYWVFAARTSIGNLLDPPVNAPPLGILHHFYRLALVTTGPAPVVLDCRVPWPPNAVCCCTEVVVPGQSIQAAIDRLPLSGGCVCLKTGVHNVTTALRIERSNVCLHGETLGAIVRSATLETLLQIGITTGVRIENICTEHIRFEATEDPLGRGALIVINNADDVAVRECEFAGTGGATLAAIAASAVNVTTFSFERNEAIRLAGGVLVTTGSVITVSDNLFLGAFVLIQGPLDPAPVQISVGVFGIRLADDCGGGNRVTGNIITDYRFGVYVGRTAEGTVIEENLVRRSGVFSTGGLDPGELISSSATDPGLQRAFAIASRAAHTVVANNAARLTDPLHGGILALGSHTLIEHNRVESTVEPDATATVLPLGILVAPDVGATVIEHCAVRQNLLQGMMGAILLEVATARADANDIIANSIVRTDASVPNLEASFTDDTLDPVSVISSVFTAFNLGYGIALFNSADSTTVARNNLIRVPLGIIVGAADDCRIAENQIERSFVGILALSAGALTVEANTLVQPHVWGIMAAFGHNATIARNIVRMSFGPALQLIANRDSQVLQNQLRDGGYGIVLWNDRAPIVRDNSVDDMRRTGIAAVFCTDGYQCVGNWVSQAGYQGSPFLIELILFGVHIVLTLDLGVGISVLYSDGPIEVADCEVRHVGTSPVNPATASFNGMRIGVFVYHCEQIRVHGSTMVGALDARLSPDSYTLFAEALVPLFTGRESNNRCDLLDNFAEGRSETIMWGTAFRGELVVAANRCHNHRPPAHTTRATLHLEGAILSATGNRVRTTGNLALRVIGGTLAAVGNVTSNAPALPAATVPVYATANVIA